MVENERAIIGTPDDAVEKIEQMLEVTGGFRRHPGVRAGLG
jgi:alkanesulfonate monooxygenase SsuD/methylene tetrahydromethanopterin reductase-like flavin-dependent oxidoreductase (luciferase family)